MSRLLDPHLCPDCRSAVSPAGLCTACDLDLTGSRGRELWSVLTRADAIVEDIRRHPATASRPTPPAPPATPAEATPAPLAPRTEGLPHHPGTTSGPRRPRPLSGVSASVVLLATGGLMVLVAAVLFLTVSWSSLPPTAKAGVAAVATLALVGVAAALTRRGLRSSSETLWGLSLALLALDVEAARRSGLVDVSGRTTLVVVGALLVAAGLAAAGWARSRPVPTLVLPQVGAGVGALVLASAGLWTGPAAGGPGALVSALVPLPLVVAARRGGLRVAAGAFLGVALLGWLVLVGAGVAALSASATRAAYWTGLAGWPLLAAALVAAAATAVPRTPQPVRVAQAAAALGAAAVCAQGPAVGTVPTLALAAATGLVLGAVALLAPRTWALGALVPGLVTLALAGVLLVLAPPALVVRAVVDTTGPWWDRGVAASLPGGGDLPLWLLALGAVAGLSVAAGALRATGRAWLPVLLPAVPAVAALTVLVRLATSAAPLWTGVAVLVLGAAATAVVPGARRALLPLAVWLLVLALVLALPSALLTALLATATTALVAALVARWDRGHGARAELAAPLGAVAGVLLAAYAGFGWVQVAGAGPLAVTVTVTGTGAVLLVAAAYVARRADTRAAVEGAAALVGLLTAAATDTRVPLLWALGMLCTAGALAAGRYAIEHDRRSGSAAVAVPAALAATALASGAAHAWTALAGASPLVASLVVTLVGAAVLLLADLACRRTTTRLAAQVGATATGATATLVGDSRTDLWLVAAVLGTSLALAALRHLVRWDRVRPDARAAAVAAAVLVAASTLAVRGWAGAADVAGTPTALLVAAVTAAYLLGARRVARLVPARLAVEATALGSALAALALTPRAGDAWLLQAAVATALVVVAVRHLVDLDRRAVPTAVPGGVASAGTVAAAAWAAAAWAVAAWAAVADLPVPVRAALLVAVAVVALMGAAAATRGASARLGAESAAVAVGAAACAVAPTADLASVLMGVLGTAGAFLVLRHRDRDLVAVPAALLLALAEVVRVGVAGPPELVALPGAAVLIVAGVRRAAADADLDTWRALGAGLALALVPSLLLVLPDPVQGRTLLVGAGALAAVTLGGVRRWQAPLLVGAAVLTVLALRFLGPLAAEAFDTAVGPWVTFGVAGAGLLVAGVVWERALARLREVSRQVVALR